MSRDKYESPLTIAWRSSDFWQGAAIAFLISFSIAAAICARLA